MTTPSAAELALATLAGFQSLLLEGKTVRADIAKVLRDATVSRTIEGASTLSLDLYDDARKLLRSGIFSDRITMSVDSQAFELVQVRKSGPGLDVVLEDLPIAALRRRNTPVKVAPGTTNHVNFSERLVKEEGWLHFWTPDTVRRTVAGAQVEMARGKPDDPAAERENTWDAIGRLADVRGWRRYVLNPWTIAYVPETFLVSQPVVYRFTEHSQGVDYIDFDFDIGKPVATVKLKVRAARWAAPVGTCVEVYDMGLVDGKWLVTNISRSIFSLSMDVTLTRARPTLPEPPPEPAPSAEQHGADGGGGTSGASVGGGRTGATSSQGYIWPTKGLISSRFGQRNGRLHAGLDIAAPTGTSIVAARAGTVTMAGVAGGYGNAVYVDHGGGVITRYGHMSRITTRRGVRVNQGDQIGLVGSTGNSTGPHLHFEVRIGGSPKNPEGYLP